MLDTSAEPRPGSGRPHPAESASDRIQFRRGLTLTLMTLVMPGSAQLVLGNKRVGRIAIRIWLGCLAFGLLLLVLALTSRSGLFALFTNPRLLTLGRWLLIGGALAWVALMIDAWRLGQPLRMARRHRLWMTGLNGVLCMATAGVMFFAAHLVSVQSGFIDTVFAASTTSKPKEGRYNVLLMGTDSGPDRSGFRPDSMTVASVDAETGRTVLIGLPRNLQEVPFPKGSFMKKKFPRTFDCEGCYLNAVNTWANDHAAELGAGKQPGIRATMDAIEAITGLKLNYYALVNMHGFSELVDAVGGVTVNVRERTAIGGIGSPIRGWIEPGKRKLTGDQALWYSRSRVMNDDFSRMGRQKCVMNAMLQQMSPKKVLLNVEAIADSSKTLLSTNIPAKDLNVFMDLALKARHEKVSTVSLVPPVIYTGNPDYPKVRRMISTAIAKAEGQKVSSAKGGITTARLSMPKVDDDPADTRKANQSDDLASAC
ncbi:MAG: LCP family protein [Aeromicrobium erythreum]